MKPFETTNLIIIQKFIDECCVLVHLFNTFKQKNNLTGEKMTCIWPECQWTFKHGGGIFSEFKRHFNVRHGIAQYKCQDCGKVTFKKLI